MKQIILHTFTRNEIETLDFARFDAIFGHWPQLWGMELKEKFDSLVFLVDGYNDHPDEIYVIPEIRAFFQALHKRWPWWAFFLSNESASMAVTYLCLVDCIDAFKRKGDPSCAATYDPAPLMQLLWHDFGRMNYLWSIAGMSEEANDQRSDEILKLFTGGATHD